MNNQVELLAPVGSMESLHAAIQNGANAIYLGGKLFNARHYASNFDNEELKEAIEYAHLRGVKVYVTLNILMDNSEMEDVIDYIKFLYEINVDALIVQDLGLASLVKEIFPKLDIHASTQMTINNLPGVELLENIGFSRVVLARETPIEEIKHINKHNKTELESFIHGALCVSYSGQCLMSSMIGGRSGNRGKCAQPCRMPSSIVDENGVLIKDWDKKHILSPRDLNTLDKINEIVEAGIISLKIEGRMKRPEYVATVVKNYRKALDEGKVTEEDKKDVEQIFNRGFTSGVGFGAFGSDFVTVDRPDNRGSLLGKVSRVDKYKVYVALEEDLKVGDGIEFDLGKGEYKGIKSPVEAKKGTLLVLEKPGFIANDSLVYKTSSVELLAKAQESYRFENVKKPIDMEINIVVGQLPTLRVRYKDKVINIIGTENVQVSAKVPMTKEKVIDQLSKLGDTTYGLNHITVNLDENAFMPVSVLNSLRREATEKLDLELKKFERISLDDKLFKENKSKLIGKQYVYPKSKNKLSIKVNTMEQFNQLDLDKLDRIYLGFYDSLDKVISKIKEHNKEIYIWTDKILYQKDLDDMAKLIKPIEHQIDGIAVSNLGSFKYFKDNFNLKIHGDMGLNIFNSYTLDYLNKLGLNSGTLSPELNLTQIKTLQSISEVETEALVYGFLNVMTTKHCPMSLVKGCKNDKACKYCEYANGYAIKDRMNVKFRISRKVGYTNIYNSVPIMVVDSLSQILNTGVSFMRLDFNVETKNIKEIQSIHYDYINNKIDIDEVNRFLTKFKEDNSITNGHYFRGVMQ